MAQDKPVKQTNTRSLQENESQDIERFEAHTDTMSEN